MDTSYIVEGMLKRKELLEADLLITVDLAIHETANSIWKHQILLKDIDDGRQYLSILYGLVESGRIRTISPGTELMGRAYSLAVEHNIPVYDTVFVALALEMRAELGTFDARQERLMKQKD